MKRIKIGLALLAALFFLNGCAPRNASIASQRKIYFVVKSVDTQFWRSAIGGANAAKAEYNVELTVVGPETEEDYAQQNACIEQAIAERADAIIFSAISYTDNADAIQAAAEAGIKIVIIDSDVDSRRLHARIGTDNIQAGRMTGMAVLDTDEDALCVGIVNFD